MKILALNHTSENDTYLSVKSRVQHEIKVKGSRFIGIVIPVDTREAAEELIENIRKQSHDATHHCYAWRIGLKSDVQFQYNDDGEPSGTAGKPIYDTIEGRDLNNLVCVVTRYFGGTKLGTGGLARAYSQCASETLDQAKIVRHLIIDRLILRFEFDHIGAVMPCLSRFHCKTIETRYQPAPEIEISVRQSLTDPLCESLVNETAGQIEIIREET